MQTIAYVANHVQKPRGKL